MMNLISNGDLAILVLTLGPVNIYAYIWWLDIVYEPVVNKSFLRSVIVR